jgi:hypothetical protein
MTSPIIKKICNEFLNSSSSPKAFIEPFFDDENIIEKTNNVSIETGKTFILEKESVWKPSEGQDCNTHNNMYFTINQINENTLLTCRYSNDTYANISSIVGWLSNDGLTFDNTIHEILPFDRDNHDPYFHVHEDEKHKMIGIFRGRSYFKKLGRHEDNTGLHYHKFVNNDFDLNIPPMILGRDTNSFPSDAFDSLNNINYYNDKFFSHIRINRISDRSKDDCPWLGNNYLNRGVQVIIHDKLQKKIEKGIQVCRFWDLNKKEIFETDIYIPNVFNYNYTEYNFAIPTGLSICSLDGNAQGNYRARKIYYPIGLFITKKECQLNFLKIYNSNSIIKDKENQIVHFIPGMIESSDHKKYFIYYHVWFTQTKEQNWDDICNKRIDCYSIEKDRFHCLSCNDDREGFVKIKLKSNFKSMFINFETFENGYIICELKDKDNNIICTTNKVLGNHLDYNTLFDISETTNNDYIQFTLYKTNLYSYKLL